jgi:aspartate aminotransferase-like enzyme
MIKQYLLSPGPTPIPNEVALAMSETMIHHRTPQFNKVFEEARQGLKTLFGTNGDVLMLASSGTGAMEAAVANLFSPGDKVLVINGGKFGERWLNIANAFGLDPIEVKVEWGQAVKVKEVERQLNLHPDIQSVMIQASETSTTVLHPVKEIAKLTKNGPLFLVDGVTAVGVLSVPLDEWGIDALVTGSQKALMLPPGLAFIALSDRAWEKTKKAKLQRFYFDLNLERKNQQKRVRVTPAVLILGCVTPATDGAGRIVSLREILPYVAGTGSRKSPWDSNFCRRIDQARPPLETSCRRAWSGTRFWITYVIIWELSSRRDRTS